MIRLAFLAVVLYPLTALAAWRDVYESTVRIERPGSAGSGVIFYADADYTWVLTNAHVVGRSRAVSVIPFQRGRQHRPIRGTVTLRGMDQYLDAAIIRVNTRQWPGIPRAVPLSFTLPREGEEVITVGCPRADWPSLWHGRIRSVRWPHFDFFPGRAGPTDMMSGRSGSAVCDAAGTKIIGLVTWYDPQTRNGRAQSLRYVIERLWKRRANLNIPDAERLPYWLRETIDPRPKAQTPTPAGSLVPVERYRKPDGSLPRTISPGNLKESGFPKQCPD